MNLEKLIIFKQQDDENKPTTNSFDSTTCFVKPAITGDDDFFNSFKPTPSLDKRIKGFIICFVVGYVLTFMSTICIFANQLVTFTVLYSFGNIVAISSTCFLMGPIKQFKNLFAEKRIIATTIMLTCIIATLVVAFTIKNGGLCLIFAIIQFLAMTWYSLSYIPFARNVVKKCIPYCTA